MNEREVQLREWPGLDRWRAPEHPEVHWRFGSRVSLVLFAASAAGADGDRFGLGGFLVILGRSVVGGGLLVADDLDEARRHEIDEWAQGRLLDTVGGPTPWRVVGLSAWFRPRAQAADAPFGFYPRAYSGAGFVVGYDLGRFFTLTAGHVRPDAAQDRRAKKEGRPPERHHPDAWRVWPPGVRRQRPGKRTSRESPHCPELLVEPRRVGWSVRFAAVETSRGHGKLVDDRGWTGAFVDLASLSYALDADRGASFGDHRVNFCLTDADGAGQVALALGHLHELAVAADERAGRWLTSSADRARLRGRIDLARVSPPGRSPPRSQPARTGRAPRAVPPRRRRAPGVAPGLPRGMGRRPPGPARGAGPRRRRRCVVGVPPHRPPPRMVGPQDRRPPRPGGHDRRAAPGVRTGGRRSDGRSRPGPLAALRLHDLRGRSAGLPVPGGGRGPPPSRRAL